MSFELFLLQISMSIKCFIFQYKMITKIVFNERRLSGRNESLHPLFNWASLVYSIRGVFVMFSHFIMTIERIFLPAPSGAVRMFMICFPVVVIPSSSIRNFPFFRSMLMRWATRADSWFDRKITNFLFRFADEKHRQRVFNGTRREFPSKNKSSGRTPLDWLPWWIGFIEEIYIQEYH